MNKNCQRVVIADEPFHDASQTVFQRGAWPASWIQHPEAQPPGPQVVAYRRTVTVEQAQTVRVHVSADERYELFLDGQRLGRGPERGDRHCWFFESYDLELAPGPHTLVARVFWLGAEAGSAHAQITVRPAFLLAAEGVPADFLNTGVAAWSARRLGGYQFVGPGLVWGTSAKTVLCGADYDWGHERGEGQNEAAWRPVQGGVSAYSAARTCMGPNNWMLRPALLPAMLEQPCQLGVARHVHAIDSVDQDMDALTVNPAEHLAGEAQEWTRLLAGTASLAIPAHTKRRVIVDLENYYCAYPVAVLSGGKGASIRIRWAEALFEERTAQPGKWAPVKGHRNEIAGKHFVGIGDTFLPDGSKGRRYEPFWWEAGRFLEIVVVTGSDPLLIETLHFVETHYPYEFSGRYEVPSPELTDLAPLATRVLEMCSHETYMDCPYYEQMMYVGDTRLEVLTTYTLTTDDRLPRKAIMMFDESRGPTGLTQARYPCRVPQYIPPFSLYWIGMVHDFALWRNDPAFVRARMPGVRAVLDAFARQVNQDGLLGALTGWNFVDWVPDWGGAGMPADADIGVSGILNWHLVYTLRLAAELEEAFGESEFAGRNRRLAARLVSAIELAFWDQARGVYADDLAHQRFSEHAQCFAILAGDKRTRLDAPGLAAATIYFSHYLFEAARRVGRIELLFKRLELWSYLKQMGFKTAVEMPEPSRSDCHAWGAHPVYHTFASLLGIRPAGFGFKQVRIEPQLGPLPWGRGVLPHPDGVITIELDRFAGQLRALVELPPGVTGTFVDGAKESALKPGLNTICGCSCGCA